MEKKRFDELDVVRGICMLLVFFQHSILYFPINFSELYPWCNHLFKSISTFFMPCFFLVSGFLYGKSKRDYKSSMMEKTRRLLVPYAFVCVLQFGVKMAVPSMAFRKLGDVSDIVNYYVLGGGDRWFLYCMFMMFVVLAPFKKNFDNKFVAIIAILALILLDMSGAMPGAFLLGTVCHFSIFFLIGYVIKDYYESLRESVMDHKTLLIILFALCNGLYFMDMHSALKSYCLPIIGTVGTFAFSFALLKYSQNRIIDRIVKSIKYVGCYSLQFYVFTGFVLVIARTLIVKVVGLQSPFTVIPAVFVVQMVLATAGVWVCKRIKLTNKLMGY